MTKITKKTANLDQPMGSFEGLSIGKGLDQKAIDEVNKGIREHMDKSPLKDVKYKPANIYGTGAVAYVNDRPKGVAYTYTKKSKVMPRPNGFMAVRMRGGDRGWYKVGGKGTFFSDYDMQMCFRGVDYATDADKYEKLWIEMTPNQKAKVMERSFDIDWDAFWKTEYNSETGLLNNQAEETIEEIFNAALAVE